MLARTKRKMPPHELKALLAAERSDALSALTASRLSDERATALDYYMGEMARDMPAPEGRSAAISTDVADTIEGLMPPLMDIFAGGDDVVRFDAVGPQDVQAAAQETDYVNHVFMQKNPGFLVLYSFIKDALLSKVGIAKVWWEEREEAERETYLDLDEAQFAIIAGDPDVEIVEHSVHDGGEHAAATGIVGAGLKPALAHDEERSVGAGLKPAPTASQSGAGDGLNPAAAVVPPGDGGAGLKPAPTVRLHDVTVETRRTVAQARVEGVAPEEFGISRRARSIREADYCFHDVFKSQSRLIAEGYDEAQVRKLPSYALAHTTEEGARDTVDESTLREGDDGLNEASRLIRVTEHYVRMDYEGEGEAALYRVTTAGEEGEVLSRDGTPDIHREDMIPFAAMTPVIVTHRFFGRSVADLVLDVQRIKTALLRGMLDNLYLHNNPRVEVSEAHAGETTLDDLLVSRPGGIVRTKVPGGIAWQTVPDITPSIYPALQYMDATREWRTGVSRQGQGVDPNALQNQVATIANQMFNATQAKVKLIARIFAETGIRDLFSLLHAVIRKHGRPASAKLRNQWVTVDPRDWKKRDDMTISVGLGTGSKSEQLAHLQLVVAAQTQAVMGGLPIVTARNLYNSAKELTRLAGYKDPDQFFVQPGQPPDPNDPASAPLQKPPDPKQAEIAAKQQAEQAKIATDAAHQKLKTQADQQLEQQKFQFQSAMEQVRFQFDKELAILKAQLDERKAAHEMAMREHDLSARAQERREPKAAIEVKHGADEITGPLSDAIARFGQHLADSHAQQMQAQGQQLSVLHDLLRLAAAPKRVARDTQGRVSHVETMTRQ